jgi:hypothetical protein
MGKGPGSFSTWRSAIAIEEAETANSSCKKRIKRTYVADTIQPLFPKWSSVIDYLVQQRCNYIFQICKGQPQIIPVFANRISFYLKQLKLPLLT